jgi:hypothetical protein
MFEELNWIEEKKYNLEFYLIYETSATFFINLICGQLIDSWFLNVQLQLYWPLIGIYK